MVVGRAERRALRAPRARLAFGAQAEAALDVLELVELAWHDCYGEQTPSDAVIDDILVVGAAGLAEFVRAARLAVVDFRDLRVAADRIRAR